MALSLLLMTLIITFIGSIASAIIRHTGTLSMPRTESGMAVMKALLLWFVFNHIGAYASTTPELVYKGF